MASNCVTARDALRIVIGQRDRLEVDVAALEDENGMLAEGLVNLSTELNSERTSAEEVHAEMIRWARRCGSLQAEVNHLRETLRGVLDGDQFDAAMARRYLIQNPPLVKVPVELL